MAVAKKAAAKKAAAPKKTAEIPPETPVNTRGRAVYDFPLGKGDYFSVPVMSKRSTNRGPAVTRLKRALDLRLDTPFDEEMADAVGRWQEEHDLPYTRVVDKATWDSIFEKRAGGTE